MCLRFPLNLRWHCDPFGREVPFYDSCGALRLISLSAAQQSLRERSKGDAPSDTQRVI